MRFTDPIDILNEGFFDWDKNKKIKSGEIKSGEIESTNTPIEAKDVTPNPKKEAVNVLIRAYNSADVSSQLRFLEILIKHDKEKIEEVLNKSKDLSYE